MDFCAPPRSILVVKLILVIRRGFRLPLPWVSLSTLSHSYWFVLSIFSECEAVVILETILEDSRVLVGKCNELVTPMEKSKIWNANLLNSSHDQVMLPQHKTLLLILHLILIIHEPLLKA